MNILVIEDEKKVANFIKKGLETGYYNITLSYDGADGLAQATSGEFDLIILDRMLPKMDGLEVLQELRKAGNLIPVLMLTAKSDTSDLVSGLDAGADDYLGKPFAFAELQARVRALVRRNELSQGADIHYSDLRIDPVNHKIWRGKTEIVLSGKEYRVLAYLVRNAEKPVSRQELADNCWDEPFDKFTNIVDVYINYLRKKVDGQFKPKLIHTIRGVGYAVTSKAK
jgi:DNA-binding response OmpR family regulator